MGFLVAGTITPAGGIAVGPSIGARGIAFTIVYAWMFVSTTPTDKNFNQPIDPAANPQFRTSAARAWIVGASYTFGGS